MARVVLVDNTGYSYRFRKEAVLVQQGSVFILQGHKERSQQPKRSDGDGPPPPVPSHLPNRPGTGSTPASVGAGVET